MASIIDDVFGTAPRRRRIQPQEARPIGDLLSMMPPGDKWRDFQEEIDAAQTRFKNEHPLGLRRDELNFSLETADDIYRSCAEKLVPLAPYFVERYGYSHQVANPIVGGAVDLEAYAKWLEWNCHDLHFWELGFLSIGEIVRMQHEQCISGDLSNTIWKHPIYTYVDKLPLSSWHWYTPYGTADHKLPWRRVQQFHKVFMDFDFGVPGFDITIDHSVSWMNRRGHGQYSGLKKHPVTGEWEEVWLDGEFGLIVSRGGEHVMTIGLSPTNAGILLNQIQLRRKKGNRWLFKLEAPYFQHVVARMHAACQGAGLDLFMPTGESLLAYLKRIHDNSKPWSEEDGERVARMYNQPLAGFARGDVQFTCEQLDYRRIDAA